MDQLRADLASGKIKIPTDEERLVAQDEATVEAYKDKFITPNDGVWAQAVLWARRRVADRRKAQSA